MNQILTEMDGFDSREGVIVLAATNRADVLDLALLRPGRFDRRVVVQRPDRAGRAAILKVHTKNVPLAPDVSLERIAAETPGLVGAELRNLVNEAALLAARKDANAVRAEDFGEAMEKITLGPARNILLNPADRRAYRLSRGGPRVGRAAGAGQRPGSSRLDHTARHGARSDLYAPRGRSNQLCRRLPAGANHVRARRKGGREARLRGGHDRRRERSPAGHGDCPAHGLALGDEREARSDQLRRTPGRGLAPCLPAPAVQRGHLGLIDAEVRRIVEESHVEADRLLAEHRDKLDALAKALLEAESLNEKEIRELVGLNEPHGEEDASSVPQAARKRAHSSG